MNSVILLGRTTNSVELKQTKEGKSVANFTLAVKRPFTKDITDFYNIVAWDKTAETISKYVGKGQQICIRGYLQNRSWEDSNGNKRITTEVVAQEFDFCEAKRENETNYSPYTSNGSQPNFEAVEADADLPF